jgi:hypothetical protein
MDPEAPRPVTREESALLGALLDHDFTGVEALRAQTHGLLAKRGCSCGCGSIDLIPQGAGLPKAAVRGAAPVSGHVLDDNGNVVGGVVLFVEDGFLSMLEVHRDDSAIPLPQVDEVDWQI